MAEARSRRPWLMLPGPQAMAFRSKADEVYYGGAAGGGKTQLAIGLALTKHRNSLILRRRTVDTKALVEAIRSIPNVGKWKGIGYGGELRTTDGRLIEVGGCQHESDYEKYQGQPHDLIAFDELPHFTLKQYTIISAWNRVADPVKHPHQRCRVIGGGNPPLNPEQEWVLKRWGPWIDPTAGPLTPPGVLRWYVNDGDEEKEVPDGQPVMVNGRPVKPRSRTFIPARLEDNPALMATGYDAALDGLPEVIRNALRYGDMTAGRIDERWQLIPTKWVVEAQKRWAERSKANGWGELSALGVDVAMGGDDVSVIAKRHGASIRELVKRKGKDTPDGQSIVALITAASPSGCPVNIDAIGIGKSAYDVGRASGLSNLKAIVVSNSTTWVDSRVRGLKFANVRSAMMWKVRSLLDPEGGPAETRLALPPDRELLADLTAPRYEMRVSGVQVEAKEKIRERIGRSTDCFVAGTLVWAERGHVPIETLQVGDRVWTRAGLRRVVNAGSTYSIAPTRTVIFSDGRTLRGTPTHPIYVMDRGFTDIDSLSLCDRVFTCENLIAKSLWSSTGSPTLDTRTASPRLAGSTITTSPTALPFIRPCGWPRTGRSPAATTFTTGTATPATTPWTTWRWSAPATTVAFTGTRARLRWPTSSESGHWPQAGTPARRGGRGTPSTASERGWDARASRGNATNASESTSARPGVTRTDSAQELACNGGTTGTRPTLPPPSALCAGASIFGRRSNGTGRHAEVHAPPAFVSVTAIRDASCEAVFNLTIEGLPEYFANGVLVHNCGDAVALACWEAPTGVVSVV